MRTAFVGALGITVLVLLAAAGAPGAHGSAPCPTSAGMQDASKPHKPSSFAPRPRPEHNAYGAPIGDKILSKRVKKKPTSASAPQPGA
jgi:hypothetical protein